MATTITTSNLAERFVLEARIDGITRLRDLHFRFEQIHGKALLCKTGYRDTRSIYLKAGNDQSIPAGLFICPDGAAMLPTASGQLTTIPDVDFYSESGFLVPGDDRRKLMYQKLYYAELLQRTTKVFDSKRFLIKEQLRQITQGANDTADHDAINELRELQAKIEEAQAKLDKINAALAPPPDPAAEQRQRALEAHDRAKREEAHNLLSEVDTMPAFGTSDEE